MRLTKMAAPTQLTQLLNPVPCVYVSENTNAVVENGRLADVAPTILKLMGLEAPKEMTGKVLVK